MSKPKNNIFETLTLKSFDTFVDKIDEFGFDFSYINESNRDRYLKGKKKFDQLQEIAKRNRDFLRILKIKEELHNIHDPRSTKHLQLKDELDSIRLALL